MNNNIPCENCLKLPVCIQLYDNYISKLVIKVRLSNKCDTFQNWWHDRQPTLKESGINKAIKTLFEYYEN